ncbi:SusC/RagA family TonB-linked outer membrane protein [Chitinophaga arvensicola]|uniref:TonB-linked outer membrane protein, SusC/RagA family n=1 Tax=Chitinophaga arvensicola TaxID=29529 RepID=A0A1I0S6Q5_9BACT|nr:TonB-dependent receptor [Chitinophaga arvensicola]SEW51295.1 TonB-linked outer membrane protein, SusC/RagA family [Chitinophaga arvensicola]
MLKTTICLPGKLRRYAHVLLVLCFLLCTTVAAFAQKKSIVKGLVRDEKGEVLAGATVVARNAKTGFTAGVQTDSVGLFHFNNLPEDGSYSFQVSMISFEPQTVSGFTIKSGETISVAIKLKSSSTQLNDVVVIGYGAVKQKNLTGAIASVKAADLNMSVASSFQQTLQGKATGVQVIQGTGQPGANVTVQLRSNPSFANAGALYVIDGVPVDAALPVDGPKALSGARYGSAGARQSPLNFINPNDIESIEFLKDASSAAIYGVRAGGGVILVTTRRGKSGKPSIQYTGSYGAQQVAKMYEVLNTKDYMEQRNLLHQEVWMKNNKVAPYYGTVDAASVATPYKPIFTQAQIDTTPQYQSAMDAITRQGYTQQHNISMSGGNGKTSYFVSGNYFDQKGVLLNSGFKRYNGRVNLDQVISDKVKVGVNLIGSNSISNNTITGGQNEAGGIVTAAMYFPANLPFYGPDGSYTANPMYANIPNPLSYETVEDQTKTQRLLSNAYGTWEIIKGLTAKANFSYDQSNVKRTNFLPTTFYYGAKVGGLASVASSVSTSKLLEYTLNYTHSFGKRQTLQALAGYSYMLNDFENMNAGNQQFVSDIVSWYDLNSGAGAKPVVGTYKTQDIWASYFGRAIYQLDDKYTLTASVRRDGASRFATNKKWGIFPAISGSWLISEEQFLKNNAVVDFLKLRAGYGETGNSNFPATAFEIYGTRGNPWFGENAASSTAIFLKQAANPNLTWETAGEFNAGVDFGILRSRITGSVDYFNKNIRNLIAWMPFPSDFTVSGVYGNSGTTKSTGYEIGLQSKNIIGRKGGFSWSSNINFSHYLNYWVKRSPQSLATLDKWKDASGKNALFNGAYGYVADGLFKGQFGSAPALMPGMLPGGIIIKDIHGFDDKGNLSGPDGLLTAADQTLLANLDPKFNFGFGNTFTYKNFDLNIYFSGMIKKARSPYYTDYYRIANLQANMETYGWNTMPVSKDRWTFKNPTGDFPTGLSDSRYASYQNYSSYYILDASYLRCRNITLGYSFPASFFQSQHTISGLRLSLDVQNPFTITSYPGLDPELTLDNFYPLSKSVVFGVNVTL